MMQLKIQKLSKRLWVCRRVDPPSPAIHVFRDMKSVDRYIDSEGGVWACKLFLFESDEKLAEFLNYISTKHKVIVHTRGVIIQKTQTHNTVNAN